MVTVRRTPAHEQFLDGITTLPRGRDALSEREFVEHVLELANWSGKDLRTFYDLEAVLRLGVKGARGHRADQLRERHDHAGQDDLRTERQRALALRDELRERLAPVTADLPRERRRIEGSPQVWIRLAHQVRLYPERVIIEGALAIRYIAMVADLRAAFDYALLLLLAANRPFGKALRSCRLSDCGRFFLSEQPVLGRPRTRYCSEAHRLLYHARDAKNRVARMRAKKTRRKLK